jgi:hypothetical protein
MVETTANDGVVVVCISLVNVWGNGDERREAGDTGGRTERG